MKKLLAVLIFISFLLIVSTCGTKSIHDKQNQRYVEEILKDDASVKSKYGNISNYKTLKMGRFYGSEIDYGYDYLNSHQNSRHT